MAVDADDEEPDNETPTENTTPAPEGTSSEADESNAEKTGEPTLEDEQSSDETPENEPENEPEAAAEEGLQAEGEPQVASLEDELEVYSGALLIDDASTSASLADTCNLLGKATSAANAWQVVSGGFTGNAASNKTASNDGAVRVQKNVVPTGTEDEFLVYLSIDYQTAMSSYFEQAEYAAVTSNNNHGTQLGAVVETPGGSDVQVSGSASLGYASSATFTIQDPDGTVIAQNITLYWDKSNNFTMYLKVSDTQSVILGTSVKNNDKGHTVQLSADAWTLIQQSVLEAAVLNQVTDVMGGNIEFVETVEVDGTTNYDASSKTLTWTPEAKTGAESSSADGDTTTIWHLNVAELVYKVRLHPDGAASYPVNASATLTYNGSSTVDFPVPQVTGKLYDISFTKLAADTNAPLAGASFQLQRLADDSSWSNVEGAICTSDASGSVSFEGLGWGTYRAVETSAPTGYKNTDTSGNQVTWDPGAVLCWTTNAAQLTASSCGNATHATFTEGAAASSVTDERTIRLAVLKQDEQGNPLAGATFQLFNASGSVVASASTQDALAVPGDSLATAAVADLGELSPGTYTLVESRVMAGYTKAEATGYTLVVSSSGVSICDAAGNQSALNTLNDGRYYLTVTNYALSILPATGSTSTRTLYAAGTLALLLGIGLLVWGRCALARHND